MLSLDRWIEDDATSLCMEAHPQLDVLHRGFREPLFVEPPKCQKDVTPDRAEPGPERRGGSGAFVVDVMVEEVTEVGDDADGPGIIIVGTEDGGKARVLFKGTANPDECVAVHLDVRVDEDEHIAARLLRAEISRRCWTKVVWAVDHDELLRALRCPSNSRDGAIEGHSPICRGNHNRQRCHLLSVGGGLFMSG
jgi:hypothetical protein